jgi:acyl carrier protein
MGLKMCKKILKEIFADVFRLPIESINEDLQRNQVEYWDSVGHMALIIAIEKHYNLELSTEQILALDSYAKAQDILKDLGIT